MHRTGDGFHPGLFTEWSKNLFTIIIMDCKTADEKLPRNYALTMKSYPEIMRLHYT